MRTRYVTGSTGSRPVRKSRRKNFSRVSSLSCPSATLTTNRSPTTFSGPPCARALVGALENSTASSVAASQNRPRAIIRLSDEGERFPQPLEPHGLAQEGVHAGRQFIEAVQVAA